MADIAAGDVTYTVQSQEIGEGGYKKLVLSVVFGDGALTYPAGGVPLTAGKMGCPNQIRSLSMVSPMASDGYVYKYDKTNNKVRIYQTAAVVDTDPAAPLDELADGVDAPAATTLIVEVCGW